MLGPEAFDAVPFLDLLADYGSPHGIDERTPELGERPYCGGPLARVTVVVYVPVWSV